MEGEGTYVASHGEGRLWIQRDGPFFTSTASSPPPNSHSSSPDSCFASPWAADMAEKSPDSGQALAEPAFDEIEMPEKKYDLEDSASPADDEKEAYIRKLDWHLMPVIFVIYMLSVLDRSNLGNAHQAGLDDGIGLVGNQYNLLGTIFYLGCKSSWRCSTPS